MLPDASRMTVKLRLRQAAPPQTEVWSPHYWLQVWTSSPPRHTHDREAQVDPESLTWACEDFAADAGSTAEILEWAQQSTGPHRRVVVWAVSSGDADQIALRIFGEDPTRT